MGLEKKLEQFTYSEKSSFLQNLDFTKEMENHIYMKIEGKKQRQKRFIFLGTSAVASVVLAFFLVQSWMLNKSSFTVSDNTSTVSAFEKVGGDKFEYLIKKGYTTKVNQSITDQGVTLTMTDAYYDGYVLSVGYTVTMPPDKDNRSMDSDGYPGFKNVRINGSTSGFMERKKFVKKIAEHQYAGILTFYPFEPLPDSSVVEIEAIRVGLVGGSGKWQYKIPVTVQENVKKELRTIRPQVEHTWNDITFKIEEVLLTPATSKILVKASGPKERLQRLSLYISQPKSDLLGDIASSWIDDRTLMFTFYGAAVNNQVSDFALRPRLTTNVIDLEREPFVYDLQGNVPTQLKKEHGGAKVAKLTFLKDKTLLTYQVKNPNENMQDFFLRVDPESNTPHLVGTYASEAATFKGVTDGLYTYEFVLEPLDPNQKWQLVAQRALEISVQEYVRELSLKDIDLTFPLR